MCGRERKKDKPARYRPCALLDDELGPLRYGCAQGARQNVPYDRGQKKTSRKEEEGSGDGTYKREKRSAGDKQTSPTRLPRSGESHSSLLDPLDPANNQQTTNTTSPPSPASRGHAVPDLPAFLIGDQSSLPPPNLNLADSLALSSSAMWRLFSFSRPIPESLPRNFHSPLANSDAPARTFSIVFRASRFFPPEHPPTGSLPFGNLSVVAHHCCPRLLPRDNTNPL